MSVKSLKFKKELYQKKSIYLLHGMFDQSAYDLLKVKEAKDIFVLEGRPRLDSLRFTSRKLLKRNITPTVISDNMAGFLFYQNWVKEVWCAYQLSDSDGAICQIGSLILAVLAKKHKVPVYLYPAFEQSQLLGQQKDLFYFNGVKVAPAHIQGYVPLVEWVPTKYIKRVHPEILKI